jgi:hypothetical protein
MAGESKFVWELNPVARPVNLAGLVHVNEPDGAGGWNSRQVALANLMADWLPRLITFQVLGSAPNAGEILALYPAAVGFTVPANFAGSKASIISNPTADFAVTIARQVNGAGAFTTIGTITFKTDGTVTLATAGGLAIAIAAGDVIKATGDGDGDSTFNGAATIVGH